MSEAIDQKAIELMDHAASAVESFAAKLDTLVTELGPEVVNLALSVARIDAASYALTNGAVCGLLVAAFAFGSSQAKKWHAEYAPYSKGSRLYMQNHRDEKEAEGLDLMRAHGPLCIRHGALTITSIVAAIFALGIALTRNAFTDIWPWVGIIEPKLWIAKSILGL